jgi:N-acetylglucosaminyldiphosphoundecaprenol N-acetyl-beta-D-mannosaminyltransferase
LKTISIPGSVEVIDATRKELIRQSARLVLESRETRKALLVTAIHVGGLASLSDPRFIAALSKASIVYADGVSVALVARLAGAKELEPAPTTDIGIPILRNVRELLGRSPRVALVGGPEGLADSAGASLAESAGVLPVLVCSGYQNDWAAVLEDVRLAAPDVLIVGLGSPFETMWVADHLDELPPCLVLTCGGWFGFLAGIESRAPRWMRKTGLEWFGRLLQDPRRLAKRYSVGIGVTLKLAARAILDRLRQPER